MLKEHPTLTNEAGFLCVDPKTLRHTKYSNIFGIGDCTSTPNSKTMAAIGKEYLLNLIDKITYVMFVMQPRREKYCTGIYRMIWPANQ